MINSLFSKLTKGATVQTAVLFIVSVSYSMVFIGCSNLADTSQNKPAITSGAYIQQREEKSGEQTVDADLEPYEWFY
jgi:hypothetical protein